MLPQEIQEKLSHTEEDYFKKHAGTLQSYMSRLDLDLTVVTSLSLTHTHKNRQIKIYIMGLSMLQSWKHPYSYFFF